MAESSSSVTHSLSSLLEAVRRENMDSEMTSMQDAYEDLLGMANILQRYTSVHVHREKLYTIPRQIKINVVALG